MLNDVPSPKALVALYVVIRPLRNWNVPPALLQEGNAELVELGLACLDDQGNAVLTPKGQELTRGVSGALA